MQLTNLTSNDYVLDDDGTDVLPADGQATVDDAEYLADTVLRRNVNALSDASKVTVTASPPGFPVRDPAPGGTSLPNWTVDAEGNVVIAPGVIPDTGPVVGIDVSAGPGLAALLANGAVVVELVPGASTSCLPLKVSGNDNPGSALYANAAADTPVGLLPQVYLTDPTSPGSALLAYDVQGGVQSAFDPAPGQAVFRLKLGDPAFGGDLFHCRDGDGDLIFQVKADGNVHIKAGASVTADL